MTRRLVDASLVLATAVVFVGPVEAGKPKYTLVPPAEAKWQPINPKNPAGGEMVVLSGDPKTGPVALLLKLPKGKTALHWHSSAYYAVTLEGTTRHYLAGKEGEAKDNPPNTFWYQPGGGAATSHGDECLSATCTLFVQMPGKFDIKPAPATKAK